MLTTPHFKFGSAGHVRWDSLQTAYCLLNSALRLFARSTEFLSGRLSKPFVVIPGALKANMAPKAIQNLGDKGEGARTAWLGKNNGDLGPAGRCPTSGAVKSSGKNIAGAVKDGKNIAGNPPPLDARGKDKLQPTITCFLIGRMQENGPKHIDTPPADIQSSLKESYMLTSGERAHFEGAKEISHGSDSPPTTLQGADGGTMDALGNRDEQKVSNREEVNVPVSKSMQPQQVEFNSSVQDIQDEVDIPPVVCAGGSRHTVKNLEVGAKKTGTRKKAPDWSKDGGDKFY
ncbi:hypothetical protein NDU88_007239 [Pleurodeles waltl]|uniref:Uncharacterized protein n=1 Tax=Pleurodeles waltl TaxID=8319 RepID=A0AAV7TZH9_PLEWA|nr:hypothetical protein NDU88_007239 [Pleurodeles waltl]